MYMHIHSEFQIKAVGRTILRIAATIAWTIRFLWTIGFLAFVALLVIDFCRIPVSVNSSVKYAAEQTLWRKMSPVEDQRLKESQEHCRHVYRQSNGLWTYYCPLCRKKLTPANPPLWQI